MRRVFGSIIPAPNPTGDLHMGHVLNLALQDVLCRWNSLKGAKIYWVGSLDHGTTSAEFVASRRVQDRGEDTSNWNKQDWTTVVNEWIDHITPRIYKQLGRMNLILDIDEVRSMGDPFQRKQCQKLIQELERAQLLYRARAVVPWCPRKRTFVDQGEISLEPYFVQEYLVQYFHEADPTQAIDLWIERPETLLNDTALVVSSRHPFAQLPEPRLVITPAGFKIPVVTCDEFFQNRKLPAIARITPGHCIKSFRWALKNQVPVTRVYDENNVMEAPGYQGRTCAEAAQEILATVTANGRLKSTRTREVVRAMFRLSNGPVEEFLTEQYFIETEKMAAGALELLRNGTVRVHPDSYHTGLEKHFESVLSAKRIRANHELADDWCISQQTAWGNDLEISHVRCREERGAESAGPARQVDHVATLKLADALFAFYINLVDAPPDDELLEVSKASVCVTGLDLLPFWIEPILMLSTVLERGLPFRDVVIHPLICDAQGRKMSKSTGNVIAPDDMWDKYGADALRFALLRSLNLNKGQMSFDEAQVRDAKRLLDDVENSLRSMQQRTERWTGSSFPPQSIYGEDFFVAIDQALAQFDFMAAVGHVERLIQMILVHGQAGDTQKSNELLGLASLLEPFAPELVVSLGLSRRFFVPIEA